MEIRMSHPSHGVTHAYSQAEITLNEKNGWHRVDFEPMVEQKTEVVATPAERYMAKFGKKPHHKMKPETILKALEEE